MMRGTQHERKLASPSHATAATSGSMRARRTEEDPMQINKTTIALTLAAAFGIAPALAQNPAPSIPRLDHVFVIVMENHHYGQIFGNANSPDWHNKACRSNLELNTPALEGAPNIGPIAGSGMDATTPAVDTTNEGTPAAPIYNDPIAPAYTVGKTIADQLVEAGLTWKSYQESLPPYGADRVNNSDGSRTSPPRSAECRSSTRSS